jgi:hypothetical protein
MQDAAQVAIETVAGRLRQGDCTIEKVTFVLFGKAAYDTHLDVARRELS